MANNVSTVLLGGSPRIANDVSTVQELADKLSIESGLQVTINGKAADYSTALDDYAFVSFGAKVKGGKY